MTGNCVGIQKGGRRLLYHNTDYHEALLTPGMSPAVAAILNRCCSSERISSVVPESLANTHPTQSKL